MFLWVLAIVACQAGTGEGAVGGGPLLALHAGSFEDRPGWETVRVNGERLYFDPRAFVTDDDIARVEVTRTREGAVLDVQLTGDGDGRLAEVTARSVGEPIIVMFRSRAVTAPVVRNAVVGGRMQIAVPADSEQEVDEIVETVRTRWPSLPSEQ